MSAVRRGDLSDPNASMRAVWDGSVGSFWVEETDRYERMNSGFGRRLLETAAPREGEAFLDVGCGHGARSLDLANAVSETGKVVGVDVSGPMLEVARGRAHAQGLTHLDFRHGDAQTEELGEGAFNGVLSQFGVMFFADPGAAFTNLRRSLAPGGRLTFTCWQELGRQQRIMVPVLAALEHVPLPRFDETSWAHAAFSLADPDQLSGLLDSAGFGSISVESVVLPEYQGSDVQDVLGFFRRTELAENLFGQADPDQATLGWDAIRDALEPFAAPDGVYLDGAAWLVKAEA